MSTVTTTKNSPRHPLPIHKPPNVRRRSKVWTHVGSNSDRSPTSSINSPLVQLSKVIPLGMASRGAENAA